MKNIDAVTYFENQTISWSENPTLPMVFKKSACVLNMMILLQLRPKYLHKIVYRIVHFKYSSLNSNIF